MSEQVDQTQNETLDAAEIADKGIQALTETFSGSREQLERLNQGAMDFIREQPVLAVAGAFGIGYLLGSLASRRWIV